MKRKMKLKMMAKEKSEAKHRAKLESRAFLAGVATLPYDIRSLIYKELCTDVIFLLDHEMHTKVLARASGSLKIYNLMKGHTYHCFSLTRSGWSDGKDDYTWRAVKAFISKHTVLERVSVYFPKKHLTYYDGKITEKAVREAFYWMETSPPSAVGCYIPKK